MAKSEEGCLSLPGIDLIVARDAEYLDYDGNKQVIESDLPLLSACIQHELDHTNGVLIYNKVSSLKRDMSVKKMEKYIDNHDIIKSFDPSHTCGDENCGEHHT